MKYVVEERLGQFAIIDSESGNLVDVSTARFGAEGIARNMNATPRQPRYALPCPDCGHSARMHNSAGCEVCIPLNGPCRPMPKAIELNPVTARILGLF